MLPSNTDLQYFQEIAKVGNLSRAATTLGVAQPSLTLAVRRLEDCVGTSLFVRSRQGVKLTKAGENLFLEMRELLQKWDQIQSRTLSAFNEVKGRYSIGCHPSVAIYSMPLFLPKLVLENPELEISLVHDLSRSILAKVVQLEVDLGIVINPTPHQDLVMKTLGTDTVTLWQSATNRNQEVLICDPSLLQTQDLLRKLNRGLTKLPIKLPLFKRRIESGNLEVIAGLATNDCGIAILPTRVAQLHAKLSPVPGAPKFQDEIVMAYRTEHRNVKAIQELSLAIQNGFRTVKAAK